jgi:hypothetical protein
VLYRMVGGKGRHRAGEQQRGPQGGQQSMHELNPLGWVNALRTSTSGASEGIARP